MKGLTKIGTRISSERLLWGTFNDWHNIKSSACNHLPHRQPFLQADGETSEQFAYQQMFTSSKVASLSFVTSGSSNSRTSPGVKRLSSNRKLSSKGNFLFVCGQMKADLRTLLDVCNLARFPACESSCDRRGTTRKPTTICSLSCHGRQCAARHGLGKYTICPLPVEALRVPCMIGADRETDCSSVTE